jgi:DNA-binding transcriptional LysR family regulator
MAGRAPINLNRLAYYAAVVDAGSFTAAAERLGVTKAVVSQQVARLEQDLRTTLLFRTTRSIQPTQAGQVFHGRCQAILREAEAAFEDLAQATARPTGLLRLTAPFDYGTAVVTPTVTAFRRRYPECEVAVTLSDRTLDLVSGQIDLAIHVGWLNDSGLQARRISGFRQLLVCAPEMASAVAGLQRPEPLADLPFVANAALREPRQWHFARGTTEHCNITVNPAVSIDATPAVHAAVLAGGGLSVLPDFLVAADLAAGRLIHVLPEWILPDGGIHVVFPAARFRPTRVRAFVDLLTQHERRRGAAA